MALSKRLLPWAAALFLILILSVYVTRESWLGGIGRSLTSDEAPVRADAVLVLAGDHRGQRVLKACELVRNGFAPVAFVSGPMEWYGVNEAVLAIRYAESKGCPASWFEPLFVRALSTTEEADVVVPILEGRGIRKLLLVTSNYHTSRSRAVFRKRVGTGMDVRAIAAPDAYFTPDGWWWTREGQKTVFFEISKTIAWRVGL